MFLLDTNVVSELRKAGDGKADSNVIAWLASVDAAALYLSAITLLELELGVLRIERRDAAQGASASYPNSESERSPSTQPWPFAARLSTCPTHARSVTRSSQRPPSSTAWSS